MNSFSAWMVIATAFKVAGIQFAYELFILAAWTCTKCATATLPEVEEHVTIWGGGGGGENKMGNLGLWIILGIPRSYMYVRINISPPLAQQSHESCI